MNKKKIIIIVAVAVVLFILWKYGTFDSLLGKKDITDTDIDIDTDYSGTPVDTSNYVSIIDHTSMSAAAKTKCKVLTKSYLAKGENLGTTDVGVKRDVNIYDLEVQSAKNYGITFTQQAVRTCISQMVGKNGSLITKSQAETYMDEVLAMD